MGGDLRSTMEGISLGSRYPEQASGPVGNKIEGIYRDRLRQFISGGQYESQNLIGKLYDGRVSGEPAVKLSVWGAPNLERPTFEEASSQEFRPTRKYESFGPSWATFWFRIHLTVPEELRGRKGLEFHWDANNEGLIWTADGVPVHGLTGGGERTEWILPESFKDGKEHMFYIEMACNGMFGNGLGDNIQPPNPNRYFQLQVADIVAVNLDARGLHVDFWVISDAAREFPGDSWQKHKALEVCNEIMNTFIAGDGSHEAIRACRKVAQKYIGENVDSEKVYQTDNEAIVTAIGNCHIDTNWLWPWDETKRKVARSWSNQCDLMDRYPELRFACSQAQQYKWLEQYYPAVWDRVKTKVKEGKFHPIGGSWVEHDTNLPSGESLVRQFLYGQRFFESRFGDRCTTFWLPDTFGYSAQLPQLCRQAGMTRFFTQKLSWNNINEFPHTTFNWVALDKSQVLCHMTPAETYTAEANFGDVKRSITQHKSMGQDPSSLLVYGKGDGGGGTTWLQIEKLRRCRGISDTVGLLPRIVQGDSVDDFFARLQKRVEEGTKFATWYGELYFEFHRGTYTSQANTKRNNRLAEILLRDIELVATLASVRDLTDKTARSGYRYPKADLDKMWESVLICQFHDCLPGSSIEMCYEDADKLYAKVFKTGERLLKEALSELGFATEPQPDGGMPLYLNTLPWERHDPVPAPGLDGSWRSAPSAPVYPTYGEWNPHAALNSSPPADLSFAPSCTQDGPNAFTLSNSAFNVRIEDGAIVSLYDCIAVREIIPEGQKAAQLVLYDDKPLYWQAWDVEVYHLESRRELKPTRMYPGPANENRKSVVIETKISDKSWVKTTISLNRPDFEHGLDLIEMDSEIEWHEDKKFLKVEFPVDITNTEASYETQFGIVKRPTHYNTSWDMAKFEVCCHRWADLSEHGYGVSILNDSKYGFATAGNVMRLSLLRAPKAPDAHADMGHHRVRYAMFPHRGPLSHRTVRAGLQFNNPMRPVFPIRADAVAKPPTRICVTGADNIVVDTVKRGEDDSDVSRGELPARRGRSVVVRLYDALGGRSEPRLHWGRLPVRRVWKTNLLEDDMEDLGVRSGDGSVQLTVRAFEVATYRLELEE